MFFLMNNNQEANHRFADEPDRSSKYKIKVCHEWQPMYMKRLNAYSRLVSSETANLCYISMLVFPYTDILPVCLLSGEWLFLFLYRLFHYRTGI